MRKHILKLSAGVMYYLDVTVGLIGPWQEQPPLRSYVTWDTLSLRACFFICTKGI